MQLYTYRARSLAEAMQMVRAELGPDASVLHTRVIGTPILGFLGSQTLEVTASAEVDVPSRLPRLDEIQPRKHVPAAELGDFRRQMRQNLRVTLANETSLVEQLSQPKSCRKHAPLATE